MSDVQDLGTHESKSKVTEVPFSTNRKCCIALTSETEIKMKTENVVVVDSESTSHTQSEEEEMHKMKNVETEVQDSNDVEDILVSPIGSRENYEAQTSFDTVHNGVTVSLAGDKENTTVADKLVRDKACVKAADTITWRKNVEDCFIFQRFEKETSNQEKCEDTDIVFNKDHGSHRGLAGEAGSSTSFSHQARRPFSTKQPPFACNSESGRLFKGRLNKVNKEKKQALGVQSWKELCDANDELYGVIRLRNGRFKCTVCSSVLFKYKIVLTHVKGRKHKQKLLQERLDKVNKEKEQVLTVPTWEELCNENDELYGVIRLQNERFKCTLCGSGLVSYKVVLIHVKGKNHRAIRKTIKKNNCNTVSEVPNNMGESDIVNYQEVNCNTVPEVPNNRSESEIVNYQVVNGLVKQKIHKGQQNTAKDSCTTENISNIV